MFVLFVCVDIVLLDFFCVLVGISLFVGWQCYIMLWYKLLVVVMVEMQVGCSVVYIDVDCSVGVIVDCFCVGLDVMLSWCWKIDYMVVKGDFIWCIGDDFVVCVYVFFDVLMCQLSFGQCMMLLLVCCFIGENLLVVVICYVWDNYYVFGIIVLNLFYVLVCMVVIESGNGKVGQWVGEYCDLVVDFCKVFGCVLLLIIGIVIVVDIDNMCVQVNVWFGDVCLVVKFLF